MTKPLYITRTRPPASRRNYDPLSRAMSRCEWDGECLVIPGSHDYPTCKKNGRTKRLSRELVERYNGITIPAKTHVCHTCDNPKCLNIEHLFLGDDRANVHDCIRKGRRVYQKGDKSCYVRGNQLPQAKLTEDAVRAIRMFWSMGAPATKIGKLFGVAEGSVRTVVYNKWRHVSGPPLGDWSHIQSQLSFYPKTHPAIRLRRADPIP